ncbi:STAS domain-containing protein [Streptomyces sp. NPDC058674]|uniref:STAS domain-containing protein n=1 Tax=Streptomyces sp. NPDC058674 TaxID=3346592 RepID=UPI003653BA37
MNTPIQPTLPTSTSTSTTARAAGTPRHRVPETTPAIELDGIDEADGPGGSVRVLPGDRPDTVVLVPEGEFDHYTARPLDAALARAAADGRTRLLIDASALTFCDSALLRVLDHWSGDGRRWEIGVSSRALAHLFEVASRVPGARSRRLPAAPTRPRPDAGARYGGV